VGDAAPARATAAAAAAAAAPMSHGLPAKLTACTCAHVVSCSVPLGRQLVTAWWRSRAKGGNLT